MIVNNENRFLIKKYKFTSWFYDILDYPWEIKYKKWRPQIVKAIKGEILEAGVGTGRNLKYYPPDAKVTGVELSPEMLKIAQKRARKASCSTSLLQNDATQLKNIKSDYYNWYISTFMFCVMPDHLQPIAINQMARVLKKGGKFKIIEMVYSKNPKLLRRQKRFAPFVEKIYGARFDRNTLFFLKQNRSLEITHTKFLKADTYLLVEGTRVV